MAQVPRFKGVMYTTETLYQQLITEGSITVDGITYNYDPKMLYVTELEIKTTVYSVNGKDGHVNLLSTDLPDSTDLLRVSNIGTGAGQIPVLSSAGKIPEELLPAIALTDIYEADSEVKMLALVAQKGDVCIRTDISKTFVLRGTPANTLTNWIELRTPTDPVLSVNGKIGAVELASTDLTDGSTLAKTEEVDAKLNKAIEDTNQSIADLLIDKVDNSVFNNLEERVTTTETDILELHTTKADKSSINQDAIRFAEEERQIVEHNLFDLVAFGRLGYNRSPMTSKHVILRTDSTSNYSRDLLVTTLRAKTGFVYTFKPMIGSEVGIGYISFKSLKPNTEYRFSCDISSPGSGTFGDGVIRQNLTLTFTSNANGTYSYDRNLTVNITDGSTVTLTNVQLIASSEYSTYVKNSGGITHTCDLALYHHSFGLTVSGSNWRSYGINLILPTYTKFTKGTFAQWLYSQGYTAYNRTDESGRCLWLAGSNFGAGGGYGTPLAVFSPDASSVKVQISGSNTLSEDTVDTIISYSVRDIFSDAIIK